MHWVGAVVAVAVAGLAWFATGAILRALPEPAGQTDKIPYPALATPGFATAVAILSGLACLTVTINVPPDAWLAWAALVGPGVLSASIDARTTYLPKRLAQASWVLAGLGVGWLAVTTRSLTPLVTAGVGALVVGGLFWLVWRWSRGIGFGDVRLMATIGAVSGLPDPGLITLAVMIGTIVGAVWGAIHRLSHGPGPFAYGPGLLIGPFAGLWVQALFAA